MLSYDISLHIYMYTRNMLPAIQNDLSYMFAIFTHLSIEHLSSNSNFQKHNMQIYRIYKYT